MIGGACGFAGHIEICDDVVLTGMSMVPHSISKPGVYSSVHSGRADPSLEADRDAH